MTSKFTKRVGDINRKLAMARQDLALVERRLPFVDVVGRNQCVLDAAFQRRRIALCRWMLQVTTEQIALRHNALTRELGDAANLKYSDMRGVPTELVHNIAMLELVEIGLGLHPAQR